MDCTCATAEHCPVHYCAEHGGELLPCFVCGFNARQRALGAGYRAAKVWKACAKKWRRIVRQVDAECAAAHEAEIAAKKEMTFHLKAAFEMSADLERTRDALAAAAELERAAHELIAALAEDGAPELPLPIRVLLEKAARAATNLDRARGKENG